MTMTVTFLSRNLFCKHTISITRLYCNMSAKRDEDEAKPITLAFSKSGKIDF